MTKTKVGIIFGGKSAEHEVSIQSAQNIFTAIDKTKYQPIMIKVDRSGRLAETGETLAGLSKIPMDVAFPVIHGPYGEDGTLQGLLSMLEIPFVGAGVLGSAIGMDKDIMKRLLKHAGLPVGEYISVTAQSRPIFKEAVAAVGLPFFVKPANLGSSVGVNKVGSELDFTSALEEAFKYDSKILLETFIAGREIECAILGNDEPKASIPGEVIPTHEFYSYEAKYIDEHGAALDIPARLADEHQQQIQDLAIKAFQTLECRGFARVDFFLRPSGEVVINEINTIPGFTSISMYPKLWEENGLTYPDLIDRLISLAI